MRSQELEAKLKNLPDSPGCYLMKDKDNKIIYVGKAKSLKNRVKQYFTGAHDHKTTKLVSRIKDFDYVLTNTEKEALLLEINLIKQHSPHFNIMFMDDKSYPYIKLTSDEYPMLRYVREKKKDKKAMYFGPYPDAGAARTTIVLLNQIYPLRKCRRLPKKACLYYYLNECLAPCEFAIEKEVYENIRRQVIKVLKGDTKELIDDLTSKMSRASDELLYEKAKEYHDLIKAINHITDKQQVQFADNVDQDVWHFHTLKGYICIQQFMIRNGKLLRRKAEINELYEDKIEAFSAYVAQYYQDNINVKEILMPPMIDLDQFEDDLVKRMSIPYKGQKRKLLEMAYDNAVEYLERKFNVINNLDEQNEMAMREINKLVNKEVRKIEVFDNSHIAGTNTVAGMVVFINGKPSKKDYRKFQLHQANDDVASMKEVIYRRYFRLLKEGLEMPDLILVDGAYQQVNAAKEILDSLYLDIPVFGMVKDKKHDTSGLVQSDGADHHLLKDSALFFFITRIQDEVHRFAISYHQHKRLKGQTRSVLDDIKGIGKERKHRLMKYFGSYKRIKDASIDELNEVLPYTVSKILYDRLHNNDN
ncbi:MAG: excinuclease ABC subunit UvrC [Erysipelotrichaceae bacterium]|nr:excinuclease ABC subunit UvrC [Erysipelotrichaceae bacterium]MDD4642527.1 excinuclease ABC subunit UvrC [Erysipelotrichaceae bacterium]